jgi:hypothetical protein
MTKQSRRFQTAAALLLLSCCAFGQEKAIVLKAARMFDGHQMRTPGLVVVSGARILGVGPGAPASFDDVQRRLPAK